MKKWQVVAIRAIEAAAKKAKAEILAHPDNDYKTVSGEISFDLITKPVKSGDYMCAIKSRVYSDLYGTVKN